MERGKSRRRLFCNMPCVGTLAMSNCHGPALPSKRCSSACFSTYHIAVFLTFFHCKLDLPSTSVSSSRTARASFTYPTQFHPNSPPLIWITISTANKRSKFLTLVICTRQEHQNGRYVDILLSIRPRPRTLRDDRSSRLGPMRRAQWYLGMRN